MYFLLYKLTKEDKNFNKFNKFIMFYCLLSLSFPINTYANIIITTEMI